MRAKQNLVANVTYRTTEVRPLAWDSVARPAAMTDAAMREASIWGVYGPALALPTAAAGRTTRSLCPNPGARSPERWRAPPYSVY